jgi:phytoene dehydrogenase-like protein
MTGYDVVIAGGGHNGLVVAAYLLKAGVSVCVIEKQEVVGGGALTKEVTGPGFKQDIASICHVLIQANPLLLNDELKLKSKYGLKYIFPDIECTMIFPDNTQFSLYRDVDKTCASIAKFSNRDAEAYRKFIEWQTPLWDMMIPGA